MPAAAAMRDRIYEKLMREISSPHNMGVGGVKGRWKSGVCSRCVDDDEHE